MADVLVAVLLVRLGVHDPVLAFAVIVSARLAAAALVYRFIERSITEILRARCLRRPASALVRSAAA